MIPAGVAFSLCLILLPVAVILASCIAAKDADERSDQLMREYHQDRAREAADAYNIDVEH